MRFALLVAGAWVLVRVEGPASDVGWPMGKARFHTSHIRWVLGERGSERGETGRAAGNRNYFSFLKQEGLDAAAAKIASLSWSGDQETPEPQQLPGSVPESKCTLVLPPWPPPRLPLTSVPSARLGCMHLIIWNLHQLLNHSCKGAWEMVFFPFPACPRKARLEQRSDKASLLCINIPIAWALIEMSTTAELLQLAQTSQSPEMLAWRTQYILG